MAAGFRFEDEEEEEEEREERSFLGPSSPNPMLNTPQSEPEVEADSTDLWDSAQSITNEFTKSYGFRYEKGEWSWSLENIGKSFKEDPVFTTLDYLLLAVPVAKWGSAAYKVSSVSKGTSAAKRAYQAGADLGKAKTLGGRVVEAGGRAFGVEGMGRAAELEREFGVARTGVGRAFSSYSARRADDPEWQKLVDTAGGRDPNELRAWGSMYAREKRAEAHATMVEAENLAGKWTRFGAGAGTAKGAKVHEAMSQGLDAQEALVRGHIAKNETELYRDSLEFRKRIHDGWNEAGVLPDEVWEFGNDKYMPRIQKEWEQYKRAFGSNVAPGVSAGTDVAKGADHLRSRKYSEEMVRHLEDKGVLTRILDPATGLVEIGRSGMALAGHSYATRLASSAVVRSADEVLESASRVFTGREPGSIAINAARAAQYTEKQREAFLAVTNQYREVDRFMGGDGSLARLPDTLKEKFLRDLGWKPLEEAFGASMPGHLSSFKQSMAGRWVDPAVAEDFKGIGKVLNAFEHMPGWMSQAYHGYVGTFKYTHTVLNPATQIRNKVGSFVFHHLNVGGLGAFNPKNPFMRRGAKALKAAGKLEGADPEALKDYRRVLRSGMIGTEHTAELAHDWERAVDAELTTGTGIGQAAFFRLLDKFGVSRDAKVPAAINDAMAWAEKRYRFTDDLAKADALLTRFDVHHAALKAERAELLKAGKTSRLTSMTADAMEGEAIARAASDVAKFQPVFSQVSPVSNLLRDAVPFSSFTTEAVRVWKNAVVEKPHLAFMYAHMIDAMSHVMGAMGGFSEQDIRDAKASLPWFAEDKKMMMLPFRVDGKPSFLDMSYLIPMANIPEVTHAEASFFDMVQVNPFKANPVLALGTAVATGIDPFSKRPVEPTFTERQLGASMEPGQARTLVGLAEYTARQLLPPLVPPGYGGINLLEWARGQKHPITGAELEQGVAKTIGANVLGLRTYEGTVNSQLLNAKREQKQIDDKLEVWWDKWRAGAANGDVGAMDTSVKEIEALRALRGDGQKDVDRYIAQGIKSREPGKFRTLSTREIEETLARSKRIGGSNRDDIAMRAELMARLQERKHRTRSRAPKKKDEKKR